MWWCVRTACCDVRKPPHPHIEIRCSQHRRTYVFISLGYIPRSGIAGSQQLCVELFWEIPDCFPERRYHVPSCPVVCEGSDSFTSLSPPAYYWTCWFLRVNFCCAFYNTQNVFLSFSAHSLEEGWWSSSNGNSFFPSRSVLLSVRPVLETEEREWGSVYRWVTSYKEKFSSLSLCLRLFPRVSFMSAFIHSFTHSPVMFQALLQTLGIRLSE